MNRNVKYGAAALIAVALIIAPSPRARHLPLQWTWNPIAQAQEPVSRGDALDFSLRDMSGHAVKLSQWRGHPIVIDFWATWCPPCRKQIPELKKLYSKYHESHGLIVVGVACDTVQGEGVKAVRPFVKEFAINYPILLAEERVIDAMGVEALPTTFFLGPDGKIVGRLMGAGAPGELSEGVAQLLSKKGRSPAPPRKPGPSEEKDQNLYSIEYRRR